MKTCALVIGHKKRSPGAHNEKFNLTEFGFNQNLAQEIESKVVGVDVQIIYRRTYASLPSDINELNPDFIISLHCNAFNRKVSGTEVLYYHHSNSGKKMAEILLESLVNALSLSNRGIRPKSAEDRGGFLLMSTNAPCIISEPFFIDNDQDLEIAICKRRDLSGAYAKAIERIAAL